MWEWHQFLRNTAETEKLTVVEQEVFFLIKKEFRELKELKYLVKEKLTIGEETFKKRMRDIYIKLEIRENEERFRPNKFRLLMDKLNKEFSQKLNKLIPSAILAEDIGITQIYPSFPREKFKEKLRRVITEEDVNYKKVDILQTFAPNLNDFKPELIECIRKGVSVRIVLTWPFSTVAKLREDVLNRYASVDNDESINFKHKVIENLQTLESIIKSSRLKNPERLLQIRLYDTIPSIALYRAGKYLLSSYFFHGQLAINNFQLEMNLEPKNPLVIDSFQKDFDLMLKLSKDFTYSLANNYWLNDLENLFLLN